MPPKKEVMNEDAHLPRLFIGYHWVHQDVPLWAYFPKSDSGKFGKIKWAYDTTGAANHKKPTDREVSTHEGIKQVKFSSEILASLPEIATYQDRNPANIKAMTDLLKGFYSKQMKKADNGRSPHQLEIPGQNNPDTTGLGKAKDPLGNTSNDSKQSYTPISSVLQTWKAGKLSTIQTDQAVCESVRKALEHELDVPVTTKEVRFCDETAGGLNGFDPFQTDKMVRLLAISRQIGKEKETKSITGNPPANLGTHESVMEQTPNGTVKKENSLPVKVGATPSTASGRPQPFWQDPRPSLTVWDLIPKKYRALKDYRDPEVWEAYKERVMREAKEANEEK